MAGLSPNELERLVNNIATELDMITDEQAVDSDIGGDSDAEDGRLEPITRSSKSHVLDSSIPSTSNQEDSSSEDSDYDYDSDYVPEATDSSSNDKVLHEQEESDSDKENQPRNVITKDEETIHWSKQTDNPKCYADCVFSEPFGPKITPSDIKSPLQYFLLFFSEFLLLEIVIQSNLYATQKGSQLHLTIDELKAWLGIVIFMGFHSLPSMRLYWAMDENFHCERIARVMSIKRFLKILRYLHLADNNQILPRVDPNFDRLHKLRPLLDYLGEKFKISFAPSRFISVDESMVAFKGRSSMKQYMPQKPIKRGFKVWVMCCAVTGYMISFNVYTGKESTGTVTNTLGERVVLNLVKALEGLGYCIFFDNFFSSVKLAIALLKRKLFSCGTFRTNRKLFPHDYLKSNKEMKKSDMDYAMSGDISVSKWMDRGSKPVCVLSTMHNPSASTTVKRRNAKGEREEVKCPESISDYNKYMGGVDRMDQMLSAYNVTQKSRRWWLKIFYYFIDCSLVNAFIIYKETMKNNNQKGLSHLQFRSMLVNELINNYCSKLKPGYAPMRGCAKKRRSGVATVQNTVRHVNVGMHLPEKITTWRRCAGCSTKQKEKRSNIICITCKVALCKNCFASFHK